jgi:hypothetical protein
LTVGAGARPAQGRPLDEGRLDPAWFGGEHEFREADEIDYLWAEPGFSFDDQKIEFAPWEEPAWLGESAEERDAKDKRMANELTSGMPEIFAEAFRNALGGRVDVVDNGATMRAVGRIVDCSTGSTAAKFWVGMGAGAGNTTFDLKFVDLASGRVVVALHHRVVSGSTLSTTDSKLVDWVDELAEAIGKEGIAALFAKGDRVRN